MTDLAGCELIGVSSSGPIGAIVAAAHAGAQVELREVAAVDTYYVAAALVRKGSGVAIVDEFTARATATPQIEVIPLARRWNSGPRRLARGSPAVETGGTPG